jgi:hypothetical protein
MSNHNSTRTISIIAHKQPHNISILVRDYSICDESESSSQNKKGQPAGRPRFAQFGLDNFNQAR